MKNKINIAIILHNTKHANELKEILKKFSVDLYSTVKSFSNSQHYDVVIVHESFLEMLDNNKLQDSKVIVFADTAEKISDIFLKLNRIQIFTIITLPLKSEKVLSYIEKANIELLDNKKNNVSSGGKTVVVTSFSNGAGKSLISYNLSAKTAQFFKDGSICLVDMNTPFSISRSLLSIEDTYNWDSIRPILQENSISSQKVQNILYTTKYQFSLLSGPSSYENNKQLSLKEFTNLTTSLKNIFKLSIIDWHTVNNKDDFSYLNIADKIIVVLDLTSISILQSIRSLAYIKEYQPEILTKSVFIFNGIDEKNGKTAELVSSKLHIDPFAVIDEDKEAIDTIMENGELFQDKNLLIDSQIYSMAEKLIKELY